jgi:hypothetical protein
MEFWQHLGDQKAMKPFGPLVRLAPVSYARAPVQASGPDGLHAAMAGADIGHRPCCGCTRRVLRCHAHDVKRGWQPPRR